MKINVLGLKYHLSKTTCLSNFLHVSSKLLDILQKVKIHEINELMTEITSYYSLPGNFYWYFYKESTLGKVNY